MSDRREGVGGDRLSAFARGRYGRILVPAAIFQIILIGPAFASGREVTQFAARFGALGIFSLAVVFVGFTLTCAVAYEFARVKRVYNYRDYVRHLIGPLWPLFDLIYVTFVLIILAALASAIGTILRDVLSWPYAVGVGLMIVAVALLEFFGRGFIESFETAGSVMFSVGFSVIAGFIIFRRWDEIGGVFERGDTSFVGNPTVGAALVSGVLYVGFNQVVIPGVLFSLDRQTTRSQAVLAGLFSALLAIVPFGLTYFAVMGFYPDRNVVGAPVVWFEMFSQIGGGTLVFLYVALFVYASIATGVGLLKAFADRINVALSELGRPDLTRARRSALVVLMLLVALGLAQFGIIALVSQGFTAMAYGFLALFTLPLLTRGVYLIVKERSRAGTPAAAQRRAATPTTGGERE
jgi:uncharacterized membrane protein YkvI